MCFLFRQIQLLKNQVQEKDKIIEHLEVSGELFNVVEKVFYESRFWFLFFFLPCCVVALAGSRKDENNKRTRRKTYC